MSYLHNFKKKLNYSVLTPIFSVSLLVGCSDGGGDIYIPEEPPYDESDHPMTGSAVKGPILNGAVTVYDLDRSAVDFKGEVLATASTNDAGSITGLIFPLDTVRLTEGFDDAVYLVEVTGGTSLTSGGSPAISAQRVMLTGSEIISEEPIYPTPLTTLAFEMAKLDYLDVLAEDNSLGFDNAMSRAHDAALNKVKVAFGFGGLPNDREITPAIDEGFDIVHTSPVQTNDDALKYRTAIEGTAAIIDLIRQSLAGSGTNVDNLTVLTMLADDLTDGFIDGQGDSGRITGLAELEENGGALRTLVSTSPASLMIPGTSRPITDVNNLLQEEFSTVAPGQVATPLAALSGIISAQGGTIDDDNDGVINSNDLFPNSRSEYADSDGDCASSADFSYTTEDYLTTSAGSGCGDNSDDFPNFADAQNVCDATAPISINEQTELGCFEDSDGDGFVDPLDVFPNNVAEWADSDGDCETTLGYQAEDYLTPTAGNDCGDEFDYKICFDTTYTREVTQFAGGNPNLLFLWGGTVPSPYEGGPILGGDALAFIPTEFASTATFDPVDGLIRVAPFRITLTSYTEGDENNVFNWIPGNEDKHVVFTAADLSYTIDPVTPTNSVFEVLEAIDLVEFLPALNNFGKAQLEALPPELPNPVLVPSASASFDGVFDYLLTATKVVQSTDDEVVIRLTATSGRIDSDPDLSCPSQ